MSSSTISTIVIAIEFVLRAVCVYAILRVTLTMFKINKAEKLEKERDAALTWVPKVCATCQHCAETCVPPCIDGTCWRWAYGDRTREEATPDDDGRAS